MIGPLRAQPGDKYAYGNQGMNVAARLVEVVSGVPYEEFVQKRLFDPPGDDGHHLLAYRGEGRPAGRGVRP